MANRLYYPGYKLNNYNPTHTERGYYSWAFNERYNVFCGSWLDRDPVNFVSSAFGACPEDVVRGYKPQDKQYESRKFAAPEMACNYIYIYIYIKLMGNVHKSNYLAHLQHYSMSTTVTMQCKKWWKRLNNGLFDICRTNAMIVWSTVNKTCTHGTFIDNLIHQYVNNRLDEGYSWKEMRTGIPDVEKGITRFSAGLRKQLVDNLLAGKKIRPAMIKDMTLNEVQDLSARACHEPILWEQSASYQTKLAVHTDKRKKNKKKKKMLRYFYCSFKFVFQHPNHAFLCCYLLYCHQNSKTVPVLSN